MSTHNARIVESRQYQSVNTIVASRTNPTESNDCRSIELKNVMADKYAITWNTFKKFFDFIVTNTLSCLSCSDVLPAHHPDTGGVQVVCLDVNYIRSLGMVFPVCEHLISLSKTTFFQDVVKKNGSEISPLYTSTIVTSVRVDILINIEVFWIIHYLIIM